jgi:hypothetical protein
MTAPQPRRPPAGRPGGSPRRYGQEPVLNSGVDLVIVTLMTIIPTLFVLALIWFPAIATVLLSFTNWNGIGPLSKIQGVGFTNYVNVATNYQPFWPALGHNLTFLAVLFLIATPIGMLLAVLLDKEMRFTRFYQTAIFLPVVLAWRSSWVHLACSTRATRSTVLARGGLVRRPELTCGRAGGHQLAPHRLHHAAHLAGPKA